MWSLIFLNPKHLSNLNNDEESSQWETAIRNMGAEPFLTDGVDVESHFFKSKAPIQS